MEEIRDDIDKVPVGLIFLINRIAWVDFQILAKT